MSNQGSRSVVNILLGRTFEADWGKFVITKIGLINKNLDISFIPVQNATVVSLFRSFVAYVKWTAFLTVIGS